MADPISLGKLYDQLTEPIRERQVSSLVFFVALLAVAAAAYFYDIVRDPWRPVVDGLVGILLVGVVLCFHRMLVMREDPSRLKNPAVLQKIKESFVGRDEDAKALTDLILGSYQVWLNGDSGVGKSVLLQKAILPELAKRAVSAVYLNSWRGDWESAPATGILAKLNAPTNGDVLARLEQTLAATPGLVIILDQFDEFQIEHRDKFIPAQGQVISRDKLRESNQFIRILNSAVRKHHVRCVFVTRRDVEWGKRAVLFEEAEEFFLKRLEKNLVEEEIAKVVPAEAVEHPENGWDGLREQLCNHLADDGILPVQMRFAVLGLDELRHSLTVSAYLRTGAVSGLISRYIEREVRRVAGDRSLAVALFPLLDRLVTLDGKATVAVSEEELLKPVPDGLKPAVMKALQELERRDIVRRVLNPDGTVLWRLDHDYLAGPVREISRRQLPEQWELKDRLQRYLAARVWQKPLRLADPFTVIRLARARFFKGLRFGPAASWFLFTVSAFLLVLAGLTYAGFGGYQWFADQELGQRLFNHLSMPEFEGTSTAEARRLVELDTSRLTARKAFLRTALDGGENAARLNHYRFPVAIALTRGDLVAANELYHSEIRPALVESQSDSRVLDEAFGLMSFWGTASTLDAQDTQQLATKLVERMSKVTQLYVLKDLAYGLGMLQGKLGPATAQELATTLVERMGKETDSYALSALAQGLGALQGKVKPATIRAAATTLAEQMNKETNAYTLRVLAEGLGALGDKVEPATTQAAATKLVERMAKETDSSGLSALAEGLGALKDDVEPANALKSATTLMERMSKETDASALRTLAEGLRALEKKVGPANAQKLATTLVDRMSKEHNSGAFLVLADGLDALKDTVEPATIQTAATKLVERMSKENNPYTLSMFIEELGPLEDTVEPQTIQAAAATLVVRMSKGTNSYALSDLAHSLGELKDAVEPQTIQAAAATLVVRMGKETDPSALRSLAQGLRQLKDKVEPATIQAAAATLVERMSKETNHPDALGSLAEGLGALKNKVEPAIVRAAATTLVQQMSKENNAYALLPLARGLGALMDKVEPATVRAAATLVERVSEEHDPDALRALANGLGSFPEGSLTQKDLQQVSAAFKIRDAPCLVLLAFDSATQQGEFPKQLRNPLCQEYDWKKLALRAATISGQPFAREKTMDGKSQIVVDFPKLSDYLSSQAGYDRLRLSLPEIATLVLLVLALVAFVLALVKLPDQRLPVGSP